MHKFTIPGRIVISGSADYGYERSEEVDAVHIYVCCCVVQNANMFSEVSEFVQINFHFVVAQSLYLPPVGQWQSTPSNMISSPFFMIYASRTLQVMHNTRI